jgi:hypothetical protein
MAGMWLNDLGYEVGEYLFLVCRHDMSRPVQPGNPVYNAYRRPAHAPTAEPMLYGWCGTVAGVHMSACGLVRVDRITPGKRAYVRRVEGDAAVRDYLVHRAGYPELVPQWERHFNPTTAREEGRC